MTCGELVTDLTESEALSVIEPFYEETREIFLGAGLSALRRTRLYCAPWIHDSPRHFAACKDDGSAIIVAPHLAELPIETLGAILAHELGHAVDFLYPAEFVVGPDHLAVRRRREDFDERQWLRWMREWQRREKDVVERTADAIARVVTGIDIGYVGPCELQCFNRGSARPQGLR